MNRDSRQLRRILGLCFSANALCFTTRVNISIAAPLILVEQGWSESQMGLLFSSFFVGYVLSMIPGGFLADRFGGRRVVFWGAAKWVLFTLITPLIPSFAAIATSRFFVGMGQGLNFPSVSNLISNYVPLSSRARAQAFTISGITVGSLVALPVGSFCAETWGWPSIFYLFGALSLLWMLPWRWLLPVREFPVPVPAEKTHPHVPWRVFLTRAPTLGLTASYFCHNYSSYFLLMWLPTYLVDVHGLSMTQMGIAASLPALASMISMNLSGWLIDRLTHKGMDRSVCLRTMIFIGMGGSALALSTLPWCTDAWTAVNMLVVGSSLRSLSTPSYWTLTIEMAPNNTGLLSSIMNTSGNVAGILAPAISGFFLAGWGGWDAAIGVAVATTLLGIIIAWPTIVATDVIAQTTPSRELT